MGAKSIKVDEYIAAKQPFAVPILNHIRKLIHKICPDVEEGIKWGMPAFSYKGSLLCFMSAFSKHCAFGFWLAPLMKDEYKIFIPKEAGSGMGELGKLTTVKDLPTDKILGEYILQAMDLINNGVKLNKATRPASKEIEIPDYFLKELQLHKAAEAYFATLTASHKREYLEWITDAKTQTTKDKRIAKTIEMLNEGKSRNWKYS